MSENGEVDLCLNDHGYEVDVIITSSLQAMTSVWICERKFNDAVKKGDIKVAGNNKIASKIQDWLRASPLSSLGTLNEMPKLDWGFRK